MQGLLTNKCIIATFYELHSKNLFFNSYSENISDLYVVSVQNM